MKPLNLFSIAVALVGATGTAIAKSSDTSGPPVVTVTGGAIQGVSTADGTAMLFRGVPYAAPPVNALRWKPPQPVSQWQGIRPAMRRSAACLQNDDGWNRTDYLSASEDCLTLDVRTPSLTGSLPVMVWIHGGSNRAGAANDTVLSDITREGIVLVAIQYRLGILGFLSHRGLAVEQGGNSGNYGLMDQIAALNWVRDNISRFGGDPNNVTIFGESAGSQDVSLLLVAPGARTLFHKAIMQSGTPGFGVPFRSKDDGFRIGDQVDAVLETEGDIARLRAISPVALLAVDRKLSGPAPFGDGFVWLQATIDGAVIPEEPSRLIAAAPPRPVLIGSNRAEFGPSPGSIDVGQYIDTLFPENSRRAREFYGVGSSREQVDPRLGHLELEIATDVVFRCPAGHFADLITRTGAKVWRYEWDVSPDNSITRHAAELDWIFGSRRFKSHNRDLSLRDYWVNFARTGDPNDAQDPHWPRFTTLDPRYISFTNRGMITGLALRQKICSLRTNL